MEKRKSISLIYQTYYIIILARNEKAATLIFLISQDYFLFSQKTYYRIYHLYDVRKQIHFAIYVKIM